MSGGLSSGRANPHNLTAPVDPGLERARVGGSPCTRSLQSQGNLTLKLTYPRGLLSAASGRAQQLGWWSCRGPYSLSEVVASDSPCVARRPAPSVSPVPRTLLAGRADASSGREQKRCAGNR